MKIARTFCQQFFHWYNDEHRHSGIAVVYFGEAQTILANRQLVLDAAYQQHPERFVRRPKPSELPLKVWINKPIPDKENTEKETL